MSELSRRGSVPRREQARRTVACYCESCDRVLYVAVDDTLFCPVCSSTVTPAEEIQIVVTGEPVVRGA